MFAEGSVVTPQVREPFQTLDDAVTDVDDSNNGDDADAGDISLRIYSIYIVLAALQIKPP